MKPLNGIRVIDISRILPGPYCSRMLLELGAEVIRLEDASKPYGGDVIRWPVNTHYNRPSSLHMLLNSGKRSIAIDLKTKEGLDIAKKLAGTATVWLEGFRPGVADRLKIGYKQLKEINPALIYCAITGYGQEGPYSLAPGHDINYQAMSGLLYHSLKSNRHSSIGGFQAADIAGGSMAAVIHILAALLESSRSGIGQFIDISMTHNLMALQPFALSEIDLQGHISQPGKGFFTGGIAAYNVYQTLDDRWLALGAADFKSWEQICHKIEHPALIEKGYLHNKDGENAIEDLTKIIASKPLAHWLELFPNGESCVTPVLSFEEVMTHDMFYTQEYQPGDDIINVDSPVSLQEAYSHSTAAPPDLGQDTQDILLELGYLEKDITRLREEGVLK